MKHRILYLDIVRCLACLMVIMIHSPQPNSANGYVLSSISLLTAPCNGLFFMVSGALLLPIDKSTTIFLKTRLIKIAFPLLLWSLFYIIVECIATHTTNGLVRSIISLPFSAQGSGILWFMYVMLGLYLLAPVLSPWLRQASPKEIEFFLLIWVITLCYPLIRPLVDVNQGTGGILYYFSGYVGFFVLGYYLHNYSALWSKWALIGMYIFPVGCAMAFKLADIKINFYDIFWNLSLLTPMMCTSLFVIAKKFVERTQLLNSRFEMLLTDFSCCSYGIYLLHIFIVYDVLWKFDLVLIPNGGGILETFVLGVIISYLIIHLISHLPMSEYLIGFKRK